MNSQKFKATADNAGNIVTLFTNELKNWVRSGDLEITIRPYKAKRSHEQNKRLWAIYGELADKAWVNGRRYSAGTWHEYCKVKFLGFELKAMPDGTELKTPISTTTLNTAEMTDYQNRLQAWAAVNFGLIWEF